MLMKSELQELARKNAEVRVIIVNGFQIVGRIMDADESAVVIDVNGSRNEVLPKSWTKVMRQSHFEFCIGQDLTHSIFL